MAQRIFGSVPEKCTTRAVTVLSFSTDNVDDADFKGGLVGRFVMDRWQN